MINFEILKKIGSGAYCKVYEIQEHVTNERYALKIGTNSEFKNQTANCIKSLAKVNDSSICKMKAVWIDDGQIYEVYELYEDGDLGGILEREQNQRLSLQTALTIFKCICRAVNILHQNLVLHGDIKPDNIFCRTREGKQEYSLGDFGFSRVLNSPDSVSLDFIGSPVYMAPEGLIHKGITLESDNYSLGVLLYVMIFGEVPFYSATTEDLFLSISNKEPCFKKNGVVIPNNLEGLIRGLLKVESRTRLTDMELRELVVENSNFIQEYSCFQCNDQKKEDLQSAEICKRVIDILFTTCRDLEYSALLTLFVLSIEESLLQKYPINGTRLDKIAEERMNISKTTYINQSLIATKLKAEHSFRVLASEFLRSVHNNSELLHLLYGLICYVENGRNAMHESQRIGQARLADQEIKALISCGGIF